VWNTVREHGGEVRVENGVHGAKFTLYLRLIRQALVTPDRSKQTSAVTPSGQGRVLVVDDEALQRDIAVKLLVNLGYTACAVETGEQALELLVRENFDLLLLDMILRRRFEWAGDLPSYSGNPTRATGHPSKRIFRK